MPLNAFVIRPFGEKEVVLPGEDAVLANGEKVRTSRIIKVDFDKVHKELVEPALRYLHIAANTTEVVVSAGNIREDMFHLLMTADLVLADVTLHNPNVFYELGIRHAFRDKFTFVIRSSVNEYPFDLKTDRYFQYDHKEPGKSVADLARAVRATLTSERADSPVFRLLPKMRTEDRARFISVPRDFLEEVERARKHRRGGDLRLLAAECEDFLWEVEGLREVGRAQFELNFLGGARTTWEEIARRYPDDVEANMILSTVYQRVNEATRSEQALARISRLAIPDPNTKAEVRSLVGRNLKAQWTQSWHAGRSLTAANLDDDSGLPDSAPDPADHQRRALQSPLLRKAIEAYADSFRENLNYAYAGLNALSLLITEVSLGERFPETWALVVDRSEEAADVLKARKAEISKLTAALEYSIAAERRRLNGGGQIDFWFEIMKAAFLCLTADQPKKVAQAYLEAMIWAPRYAEGSMRRALELYQQLRVRHPDPRIDIQANVREALAVIRNEEERKGSGNIVVFVGLRMEPPCSGKCKPDGKKESADEPMRFLPNGVEEQAKQAIRAVLEREQERHGDILFGMAASANGGDLLFHEVCADLNIPTRMYLALPKEHYIGEYVAEAGTDWVERFNRVYRSRKPQASSGGVEADSEQVINVLADSVEMPRWLQSKSGYTVGKRNSIWMLQHALVQRHLYEPHSIDITMIAMWDRREVDSTGGIAQLVAIAEKNGIKVVHIDCSGWKARRREAVAGD